MQSIRSAFVLAAALASSLSVAGTARAVDLYTPLARIQATSTLWCSITNVGPSPIDITVTGYNQSGVLVVPLNDVCGLGFGGVLPAGQTCHSIFSGPKEIRCAFNASSSKVRAHLMINDNAGDTISSVPATKK
jgi:hypothetical protein